MSWAFLHIKKNLSKEYDYNQILEKSIYEYSGDGFFLSAGGNKNTCIAGTGNDTINGFIIIGLGISYDNDELRILNSELWNKILCDFKPNQLDGHFVIFKWDENQIYVHSDLLGLRDIYLYQTNDDIYLTTNPMLLKNTTNLEIDYSVFGSRWLLFNQISNQSIFKNLDRISSGTGLVIDRKTLSVQKSNNDFTPVYDSKFDFENYDDLLSNYILLPLQQNKKLSLSLSGGMDSRFLLSYLLDSKYRDWSVHTFGSVNNPDRIIAERIVNDFKIKHESIDTKLPDADTIVNELKKYIGSTFACNPASEIIQLMNYKSIQNNYDVIIDGGFGEIWRRQFLNRIYFFGKKAILQKNIPEILKYMTLPKADIFSTDVNQIMYQGTYEQIDELMNSLPNVNEIGIENWLDLLAIKTRLVNLYSHEQTRLDQSLVCYMPFAQLSLLQKLFSLKVSMRKNGKLFKILIEKHQKLLSSYPLTKNDYLYSFNSSPLRQVLTGKLNSKLGRIFRDNSKSEFLNSISEYIGDTINSQKVKENPNYNYKSIQNIFENYCNNPNEYSKEMDWFLSFEGLRNLL